MRRLRDLERIGYIIGIWSKVSWSKIIYWHIILFNICYTYIW
jgi:hypothetical protein